MNTQEKNILLRARNLTWQQNEQLILDNVDFSIHENEFITIIGPNGAGKSSLLKALMGLIKPSKGTITRCPSLRIGYVPQQLNVSMILPITVKRFLQLVPNVSNQLIKASLETLKAEILLDKSLYNLSGGEQQRVLLARALLQEPDLLILDEPAQNLDINGQLMLYKLIRDIHQQRRCSVLMVSHDLHMVMAETTKVVCFYHHICCAGHPEQITRNPKFTELFGAQFAKLMAIYQHTHSHSHECGDSR